MKKLKTVTITMTYIVPMFCDEEEFKEVFEKNKKEIQDGYEENYYFEELDITMHWNEDAQVFNEDGTWMDISDANRLIEIERFK
jgi:hypothetical protein